jgi:hypothetical protein
MRHPFGSVESRGQKFSRSEIFQELRPEFPGMGNEQQTHNEEPNKNE